MIGGAITIGRRVGAREMPDELWQQFVLEVEQLVVRSGGTVYLRAFGTGTWDEMAEAAAVITFGAAKTDQIAAELPWLALLYGQEAIALVAGPSVLIGRAAASPRTNRRQHSPLAVSDE
jgi:hypothetical protein